MPLDAFTWAVKAPIDDPTVFRTLMCLADHCDSAGLAFPFIDETLAPEVRRSARTVSNALDLLEDEGYIERIRVKISGSFRGYLYRVLFPKAKPIDPENLPRWVPDDLELPPSWRAPVGVHHPQRVTGGQAQPVTGGHPQRVTGHRKDEPPKGEQTRERDPEGSQPTLGQLEAPPSRPDPLDGFDRFWETWPRRNGKRLARGKAETRWRGMTTAEREAAQVGAVHYAAASDAGRAGAMDAFRWLRDRLWVDWQTPDQPDERPEDPATVRVPRARTSEPAEVAEARFAGMQGQSWSDVVDGILPADPPQELISAARGAWQDGRDR